MKVFYCDHYEVPLPDGHPFPMGKYAALRAALLAEGILRESQLHPAQRAPLSALHAAHDRGYVGAFLEGALAPAQMKRIGFPWSPALVDRCRASVGGTLLAARAALHDGLAGNLAGGTHHAHFDFGAGYCVWNDLAVAARALLDARLVRRVLVFDLDVHQGDGTAALFADEPRVFTCSVHGAGNFPRIKPAGDLDVALPDGTGDDAYLEAVRAAWARSLERARPDVVFFQLGVDVLRSDRLGKLALTQDGVARRDGWALGAARRAGLPALLTLGGGYARPLRSTVLAHCESYRAAQALSAAGHATPRPGGPGA